MPATTPVSATRKWGSSIDLSQEELRALVEYRPDLGRFFCRTKYARNIRVGAPIGTINDHGYLIVTIKGKMYAGERLAWYYMTGEWVGIDHIDLVRCNNKFDNLRPATKSQNMANCACVHGAVPFRGVRKRRGRYIAQITVNGVCRHLGTFDTPEQANVAYKKAAVEAYGEYAYAGA